MKRLFLMLFAAVALAGSATAQAAPVRDRHVTAELIAENTSIQPGRPFWVGVKLTMDEGWHTYWENCGDACQPTSVTWTLPEGFKAGDLQWPAPTRSSLSPDIVNYVYEGETMLLAQITPPAKLATGPIKIKAQTDWLMCSDMCIPGHAELSLTLPVKNENPAADPATAPFFASARKNLPHDDTGWTVSATPAGANLVVNATPPAGFKGAVSGAYFYILDDGVINYEGKQTWTTNGTSYALTIPLADKPKIPATVRGILVLDGGNVPPLQVPCGRGVAASVPSQNKAAGNGMDAVAPRQTSLTLATGLLLMFLGGLVLNVMPCVFPVLALKVVGFVEQAKEGHGSAVNHAAAFFVGVMLSMWALAGTLLALRSHGGSQGWAFQMSNPQFVLGLIFLFLLIGLSMFGVFEFGTGLTGAGGSLQAKKGLAGSFFSGLLTTVAGAPCAGPFLGTAIGYALSQSSTVAMLGFSAMGLGTALPYVVFSTNPALLKFIPRPGAWMETMKQLLGFPMVATAAWFAATFVKLQGGGNAELRVDAMKSLLFGALVIAIAAWVYGKWAAIHRAPRTRWIARLAALALVAGGAACAMQKPVTVFESWSPEKVALLHKEGKPVFVDFTAEWCAICQVNKKIIERESVLAALRKKGVTLMLADWTDNNARVGAGLKAFNRDAVPLYLLYGNDPSKPPQILPQALTPGIMLDALKKM